MMQLPKMGATYILDFLKSFLHFPVGACCFQEKNPAKIFSSY
jgi:hypothetical protein